MDKVHLSWSAVVTSLLLGITWSATSLAHVLGAVKVTTHHLEACGPGSDTIPVISVTPIPETQPNTNMPNLFPSAVKIAITSHARTFANPPFQQDFCGDTVQLSEIIIPVNLGDDEDKIDVHIVANAWDRVTGNNSAFGISGGFARHYTEGLNQTDENVECFTSDTCQEADLRRSGIFKRDGTLGANFLEIRNTILSERERGIEVNFFPAKSFDVKNSFGAAATFITGPGAGDNVDPNRTLNAIDYRTTLSKEDVGYIRLFAVLEHTVESNSGPNFPSTITADATFLICVALEQPLAQSTLTNRLELENNPEAPKFECDAP